jgi:hypothetical protein
VVKVNDKLHLTVEAILAAALSLTVACDPGIAIYQSNPVGGTSTNPAVTIQIASSHPFVGEKWYAPSVTITNSSTSPISIISVELAAGRNLYANKPVRFGSYPLAIKAGTAESLDSRFDLSDDVEETFQGPVELRVNYRNAGKNEIVRALLVGRR